MLAPELLALLVCPATHQDLALATPEELAKLAEAQLRGELKTVGGEQAAGPIEAALIRADRQVAYMVLDDIPIMLVPQAVVLPGSDFFGGTPATA